MERKYNVAVPLEERVKEVNKLIDSVPDGYIVDADTLLCDIMECADFEITGLAKDVFNIWLNSTDRASVEAVFYDLTDMQLEEFVDLCLKNMTREQTSELSETKYAVLTSCEREMWIIGVCDTKDEAYEVMKNDFLKTVREYYSNGLLRAEDFNEDNGEAYLGPEYAYTNLRSSCDWKIEKLKTD